MEAKPCVISPIPATRSFDARPLSARQGCQPGKGRRRGKDSALSPRTCAPPLERYEPWDPCSRAGAAQGCRRSRPRPLCVNGKELRRRQPCEENRLRRKAVPASGPFRGLESGVSPCTRGLTRTGNRRRPGGGCEGHRPGDHRGFHLGSDSSRATSCPGEPRTAND